MDTTKFKKRFLLFVPSADKNNNLILEPGTKGFVMLTEGTGNFKIGVNINDLKEALDELNILASLYTEQKEAVPIIEGALIEGDDE